MKCLSECDWCIVGTLKRCCVQSAFGVFDMKVYQAEAVSLVFIQSLLVRLTQQRIPARGCIYQVGYVASFIKQIKAIFIES